MVVEGEANICQHQRSNQMQEQILISKDPKLTPNFTSPHLHLGPLARLMHESISYCRFGTEIMEKSNSSWTPSSSHFELMDDQLC